MEKLHMRSRDNLLRTKYGFAAVMTRIAVAATVKDVGDIKPEIERMAKNAVIDTDDEMRSSRLEVASAVKAL